MSPQERHEWESEKELEILHTPCLKTLATYLYESGFFIGNDSGLGHLASNLKIPTLTIAGNAKQIKLWRPDWSLGQVVTPLFLLPNFKGLHLSLRDNFWQHFIPIRRTIKAFQKLVKEDEKSSSD